MCIRDRFYTLPLSSIVPIIKSANTYHVFFFLAVSHFLSSPQLMTSVNRSFWEFDQFSLLYPFFTHMLLLSSFILLRTSSFVTFLFQLIFSIYCHISKLSRRFFFLFLTPHFSYTLLSETYFIFLENFASLV